jgi:SAM-dependent methyltransferase
MLLDHVSLRLNPADSIYDRGEAYHYLSVGLSASRCISEAIRSCPQDPLIKTILDFPCGNGRVLRFLRAMFPEAMIYAAEIDKNALAFCERVFSATPLMSKARFTDLQIPQRFDLIWCGSLFTHIDETSAVELLRFFYSHLSPGGRCVFTTHGRLPTERIANRKESYGLTVENQEKVLRECKSTGYGYADYADQPGYGISLVSHERMVQLAQSVGSWRETIFLEHGWDEHQDVYCFAITKS